MSCFPQGMPAEENSKSLLGSPLLTSPSPWFSSDRDASNNCISQHPLKQGSGTIWTSIPTRPRPPSLSFSELLSPVCEPLSPPLSGQSRPNGSRSNAFTLPVKSTSISTGSKRAMLADDDEDVTRGLNGEVVTPRAKKAKVDHDFPEGLNEVNGRWGLDDEEGGSESEAFTENEDILDEEGTAGVKAPPTLEEAKQLAADRLGLTDVLEGKKSWGKIFLDRCSGERGLKDDLVQFIEEQKGRSVGQSLEPIESSIEVRHRDSWPTHCKEIDEHWNQFVHNVVKLAKGGLTPPQAHFSKPTGPRKARVMFVWHYPTYAVEVTEWGMISSRRNPSIGQQIGKIGFPQDVCTDDLIPIRSKDQTTDEDRNKMWPNFDLIKKACVQRIWDNLEHQKFAVLMGNAVVEAIGASIPNKYRRHVMDVNLMMNFLGSPRPFFWILKDSKTRKIKLVLFCCWHLAFFQPRYQRPMGFGLYLDLLWNAICEFSGVPVADPWFFQDRGSLHRTHGGSSMEHVSSTELVSSKKPSSFKQPFSFEKNVNNSVRNNRRHRFRLWSPETQGEFLRLLATINEDPEVYFGEGWSVERVLSKKIPVKKPFSSKKPFSFDKNVGYHVLGGRRHRFRLWSPAARREHLRRLAIINEDPEVYFGEGWSVERVLSKKKPISSKKHISSEKHVSSEKSVSSKERISKKPFFFNKDVSGHVQSYRRSRFRAMSPEEQEKLLKDLVMINEDPETFFGQGWSVDRVRSKYKFDVVDKESLRQRRSEFRRRTPANQEKFLEEIQDLGKTPEDFFGEGWSIDKVLSKYDFGNVSIKTWDSRRVYFRKKTPAQRQEQLNDIQAAGKTPEDFFGGWNVDRVLSKIDFSVDNYNSLKSRRATFKRNSEAGRQKTLQDIRDAGKTEEDFFGKGHSAASVLKDQVGRPKR